MITIQERVIHVRFTTLWCEENSSLMREQRITSLITAWIQSSTADFVLWKQMWFACYFSLVPPGFPGCIQELGWCHTAFQLHSSYYSFFFLLCVWNSIFSAQLLQSCIQENAEISANRTLRVWADKISDKVVIVILRLGEQDWKITQLGTDTSHIKYSQMEQTTQN